MSWIRRTINKGIGGFGYQVIKVRGKTAELGGFYSFPGNECSSLPYAEGIKDYQRLVLTRLLAMSSCETFKGASVLEIGGDEHLSTAKTLYALSGKKVSVVNPAPSLCDGAVDPEKVEVFADYLENFDSKGRTYDVILGIAVLEHIRELERVFQKCYSLLNHGGCVLLHGAPCWRSNHGHHVYVEGKDTFYKFGEKDCVVDDYSHLYLDGQALQLELHKKSVPTADAKLVADFIVSTDCLNRQTAEDIARKFIAVPWQNVLIERDYSHPPEGTKTKVDEMDTEHINDPYSYCLYLTAKKNIGR